MKAHLDELRHTYLLAKCRITAAGYGEEIRWQKYRSNKDLSEADVLAEAAWVILNGGMRERVIRGLFPLISNAFFDWRSATLIWKKRRLCVAKAGKTFNHPGKLNAIVTFAQRIAEQGHTTLLCKVRNEGPHYLSQFPYLGPATSLHLAKNLGHDVAKPDRHLIRIASALDYNSPLSLCAAIAEITGDSIAVVDLVLWRYATIDRHYVAFFGAGEHLAAAA